MTNRETLIAYLTMKVAEQDWHGVADAAMDLRELDAESRGAEKARDTNSKSGRAMIALAAQADCDHSFTYNAPSDMYSCARCGFKKPA